MATLNDLATRLQHKFKDVPNVTINDCIEWVQTALETHGTTVDTLTDNEVYLIMVLGQAEGARNIALRVAHFFRYQDGDEQIDKTMLTQQYLRMAREYDQLYSQYKYGMRGGSTFTIAKRADR